MTVVQLAERAPAEATTVPATATAPGTADGGHPPAPPGRRRVHPAAALALLPLGLLGAALWLGRHVRPGADDWCFLPFVRDEGVVGLVDKFYLRDNGRVVNAALTGAYARFDIAGHQWYALVTGVMMAGVVWAVAAAVPAGRPLVVPRGLPALLAATVTALFLLGSPNTYKTFYWPASSVSHTLAPVLACAALVPLLRARSRGGRIAALATAFLTGAALGTLSEESSVVALVVLGCALPLGHLLLAGRRRAYARAWCLAGIAGTVAGLLVLVTSPGSRTRRERYGAEGLTVFAPESLTGSLTAFAQIVQTLVTSWQYLGAVAVGALAGLVVRTRPGASPPYVRGRRSTALLAGTGVVAFLVSGYLCTLVAYPVFGDGIVVVTRAWNDFLLLYVALLTCAGALIGRAVGRRVRSVGAVRAARGICAAAVVVVCAALALSLVRLGEDMRVRAGQWDRQDRWMRDRAAAGDRVLPYTPTSVAGMGEPFGKHGSWPAGCVADYYRVDRVTHATRLP
ncbi:DUF6056 family protein [Streptomyces yaizuensis]|uniref:Integral membrane protein n=1 Tax=Streptomyces yaizuensis TaxID=2989713 RepID=A0ABQ5NZP3_9ACTN|nr:DUF6056 family protein [Streptomyces sp. YSPA8]GLF95436.1 hypothetical protein SYYSPA8_14085 [Streptomyces sp. YSPA8]